MEQTFIASAPSNIAIIKYMGKQAGLEGNCPINPSLSLTLNAFRTHVRVSLRPNLEAKSPARYQWGPFRKAGLRAPELSASGEARFLMHAERVATELGLQVPVDHSLLIESANDFPSDCGLASSASSFAALTLALAGLRKSSASTEQLAELSRRGSGSSCRSFFSPWGIWDESGARGAHGDENLPSESELWHLALIVDDSRKRVSSSEAHQRVASSLLFNGRAARAKERLRVLLGDLARARGADGAHAWNRAAETVWAEFWDMHALFETGNPAFGYFTAESMRALDAIRDLSSMAMQLNPSHRRPLVTMDAGPNLHLIGWRDDASERFRDGVVQAVRSFARVEAGLL